MKNENEFAILSAKLETYLNGRSKPVADAIEKIQRTGSLLDDYVPTVRDLHFINSDAGVRMNFDYTDDKGQPSTFDGGLHDFAVGQIGDKFGIPPAYLKGKVRGAEPWETQLATTIMNEHARNIARERVLVRSVEGEVRGFLSDKYRRLNSMEIFLAFLMGAQQTGNVLVDAHSGETKGFLEVINPKIVEFDTPLNGRNYACIGWRIRNSDFGDGLLEVYQYLKIVKCMNGLVGESKIKEFHLGGRIPQNLRINEDTYQKDTAAKAALVRDIMSPENMAEAQLNMISKIQDASAVELDLLAEVKKLPKVGLTIGESEAVGKLLIENDPDNGLQGKPSLWKLVQSMTAMARTAEPERGRELEYIAGQMLK